jgi:type II secretory pathway pseudopilin PulG
MKNTHRNNRLGFIERFGFSIVEIICVVAFIAILAVIGANIVSTKAEAADLTYSSPVQTGDSALVRDNKAAAAITRLEFGNRYLNIATNGTNNISGPVVVDRVIIATAGTTSSLVLSDVTTSSTTTIATISTTSQAAIPLGIRTEGTLRAVTAGGAPADVTLSYR